MPIAHFYLPEHTEVHHIPLDSVLSPHASITYALGQGAVFSTYPKGYIGDITPDPWRGDPDYEQVVLEMRSATDQAAKVHILDATGEARPNYGVAFVTPVEATSVENVRTVHIPSRVGAMGINKARAAELIEFGTIIASVTTDFVEQNRGIWVPRS